MRPACVSSPGPRRVAGPAAAEEKERRARELPGRRWGYEHGRRRRRDGVGGCDGGGDGVNLGDGLQADGVIGWDGQIVAAHGKWQ